MDQGNSGKSLVQSNVTGGLGYKVSNSDEIYELKLSKSVGLDFTKFSDEDWEKSQEIRSRCQTTDQQED